MDFLPGAIVGSLKILIGYPFETIKIRYQLKQPNNTIIHSNILHLYKGCAIPLVYSTFKRSTQLYIYEKYNDNNTYIAGAYGGIISSIISNPFNIIKTNIQSNKYDNIISQLKFDIIKRGNIINICRDTIFSTYYLGTYGLLKKKLPDKYYYYSIAGIISGSTTWLLFSPLDYIRTNIYNGNDYKYIYNHIIKNPFMLWNGCSYMIIKSIPLNMINMVIYEYIKHNLQ